MNKFEVDLAKLAKLYTNDTMTKEEARKYLVGLGTHTEGGNIHENYGGPPLHIPRMPE